MLNLVFFLLKDFMFVNLMMEFKFHTLKSISLIIYQTN